MQMAASFAEMDEIRSIFAQIPHSKESLLQSEGEKREREREADRKEGGEYVCGLETDGGERSGSKSLLPAVAFRNDQSDDNDDDVGIKFRIVPSLLCRDLLSCRAPRPKRLSGFVGRHALKSKGFPFNTRQACPTTLGDASKTDAAV